MSAKTVKQNAAVATRPEDAVGETLNAGVGSPGRPDAAECVPSMGQPHEHASRATPCTIPRLHWWQERAVTDITLADLPMLRRCIRGFDLLGLPRWKNAERGDVAAAISVVFALLKAGRLACPSMSLPGTALLIAAVQGDAAAATVIAHLKKLLTAEAKLCAGNIVRGNGSTASASGNKTVGGRQ
jgi:hypothetical protein